METAGGGDDDRLSHLPDSLLEDVLSRLTSRQAVPTSVLSRRWRHLWRTVPCVDIDQREFLTTKAIDILAFEEKMRRRLQEWEAVEDIADAMLPPQQGHTVPPPPTLDAVRLRIAAEKFHASDRWVRRALQRRPAAFHLCCDKGDTAYFEDGRLVFPGLTLHLQLRAGTLTRRLRTLHLSGLNLVQDFADDVAAECPVLEHLQLHDCELDFSCLFSCSLRTLLMDGFGPAFHVGRLVLVAPSIVELRVHGHGLVTPDPECEMLDLVTAALKCTWSGGDEGLLNSLRHARSLSLTSFSAAALHGDDDDFPVFRNLRSLIMDNCDVGAECQVVHRFLVSSPSLETIALRYCIFGTDSRSKKRKATSLLEKTSSAGWRGRTAYACSNLKSIELEFTDGTAVAELADTLLGISMEIIQPIQASVYHGKRTVKISFAYTLFGALLCP